MGCIRGGVGTLSRAGSWAAGCSWQAVRPGRYSFGEGRFLVDTAGLPEMDGAAAGHPGSLELGSDQELEPGRREVRSSETAAAAAAVAEVGQAEGLQAECCILQRGREGGGVFNLSYRGKRARAATFFLFKP